MKAKMKLLSLLALLACAASSVSATLPAAPSNTKITGDYLECRTASVFAGPCHYNGELVTTGRDAVMAWSFNSGTFNGVDLTGVRAAAEVSSDSSLGDDHADRKTQLAVDPSATPAQAAAVAALVGSKCQLGTVVSIRRLPISFTHAADKGYTVDAPGFASMSVLYMPDDSCCTMPSNVWFSPLTPLEHRKVGYTEFAAFTGSDTDQWHRQGENSAFYGLFSF